MRWCTSPKRARRTPGALVRESGRCAHLREVCRRALVWPQLARAWRVVVTSTRGRLPQRPRAQRNVALAGIKPGGTAPSRRNSDVGPRAQLASASHRPRIDLDSMGAHATVLGDRARRSRGAAPIRQCAALRATTSRARGTSLGHRAGASSRANARRVRRPTDRSECPPLGAGDQRRTAHVCMDPPALEERAHGVVGSHADGAAPGAGPSPRFGERGSSRCGPFGATLRRVLHGVCCSRDMARCERSGFHGSARRSPRSSADTRSSEAAAPAPRARDVRARHVELARLLLALEMAPRFEAACATAVSLRSEAGDAEAGRARSRLPENRGERDGVQMVSAPGRARAARRAALVCPRLFFLPCALERSRSSRRFAPAVGVP